MPRESNSTTGKKHVIPNLSSIFSLEIKHYINDSGTTLKRKTVKIDDDIFEMRSWINEDDDSYMSERFRILDDGVYSFQVDVPHVSEPESKDTLQLPKVFSDGETFSIDDGHIVVEKIDSYNRSCYKVTTHSKGTQVSRIWSEDIGMISEEFHFPDQNLSNKWILESFCKQ